MRATWFLRVGVALAIAPLGACAAAAPASPPGTTSPAATTSSAAGSSATLPRLPANAPFDYQIGGDHEPAKGVSVVSRDWFAGSPLEAEGSYSICYLNPFQTQADEPGTERPDERSTWPADLVLSDLGDDPEWGGEYLVDISTAEKREQAAAWVEQMTDTCASKGFDAVELDNLDSWTRFDDTPLEGDVPFGKDEAVAYAALLAAYAHDAGLAVAQKNTPQLSEEESLQTVGFDLAVSEECGQYEECTDYTDLFGDRVVAVEYTDEGFEAACDSVGDEVAVVRRDRDVSVPGSDDDGFATC